MNLQGRTPATCHMVRLRGPHGLIGVLVSKFDMTSIVKSVFSRKNLTLTNLYNG